MLGTIEALGGQAVKKGDWVVVIRPGHPLFQTDGPDFKGWIWKKMQECKLELFELYMALVKTKNFLSGTWENESQNKYNKIYGALDCNGMGIE